jgi:hypothetical protein
MKRALLRCLRRIRGDALDRLRLDFRRAKTGLSGGMLVINNVVGNLENPIFDDDDDAEGREEGEAQRLTRDLLDAPIGPEPVDENSPLVDVSGDGVTLRIKGQVR